MNQPTDEQVRRIYAEVMRRVNRRRRLLLALRYGAAVIFGFGLGRLI